MAYVQQICDGYSKRTLIGNWAEERQYTQQPFRENLAKQVLIYRISLAQKMKPLPALMGQAFNGHYLDSNVETNGKLSIKLFSMMDL
jgi:hypothetical protein